MDVSHQKLGLAICDYLTSCIQQQLIDKDSAEGLEEAFHVTASNDKSSLSIHPATLKSLFDVFQQTQARVKSSSSASTTTPPPPSADQIATADSFKAQGNKKMAEKDFVGAIDCYSRAIALVGDNAVFYANRAAAYSQNDQHELAVNDSKQATVIDANYSKAYSRMGHAYFCLGKYQEAVDAYTKGISLDPSNVSMSQSLTVAQQKLEELTSPSSLSSSSSPADPLAGLAGLGLGGGGGAPGGGMDFGSMLNNPGFMDMASKMMGNPNIAEMMKNPAIASMAQNLMSNPAALQGMLGAMGQGGAPPPPM